MCSGTAAAGDAETQPAGEHCQRQAAVERPGRQVPQSTAEDGRLVMGRGGGHKGGGVRCLCLLQWGLL